MSAGTRVALAEADQAAAGLVALLSDAVHRIAVAGSIRRASPDVGDIEIVAVPKVDEEPDGMFATRPVDRLTERVDYLIDHGFLASHPTLPARGPRYSRLIDRTTGLQVDLFSATTETFGLIYLIRTGPADYSRRFVTDLRRSGLHAAEGQLHRGSLGCGTYVCEVIPTPDEESVYAAAGWSVVAPEWRA